VSWGLELVAESYFFTKRRWDEHRRGLGNFLSSELENYGFKGLGIDDGGPSWDGHEYLPQGTVGAVVLDRFGTICVATSTGGLTNKLPGRIGDTPTLGAGFWAEEWMEDIVSPISSSPQMIYQQPSLPVLSNLDLASRGDLPGLLAGCFPVLQTQTKPPSSPCPSKKPAQIRHGVAMSGTGNGDSFLRLNAARTAAAISRFSTPNIPLAEAVHGIAGSNGDLQNSAGDRWGKTGEGEGGIIGIELVGSKSDVVWDFNCGGMFRAWVDNEGKERFMVFKHEYQLLPPP